MTDEPRPPKIPVATIAVVGLSTVFGGMLALVGLIMGTGVWWWFACPLIGFAMLFGAQLIFAKSTGLPVTGPSEPMGPPPDEA